MLGTVALGLGGGVLVLSAYFYMKLKRPKGFPPGPPATPILGSLPFLNVEGKEEDEGYLFQMEMGRLAKKYGPVYSLAFGHSWIVIINDYKLIREAFVKMGTDMAGRPDYGPIAKSWNPYAPSMSVADSTYDEQWKLQRHTVLQVLRNLGYGRSVTEQCIHEEADIMTEIFRSLPKQPINISDHIGNAVANVIMSLLFGERYEYDNKEFQKFRHSINLGFEGLQKTASWGYVPGSGLIPSFRKAKKLLFDSYKVVNAFIFQKIKENPLDESMDEPRNFIQGYRMERKKNPALEDKLFQALSDFVQAGLETTTTTLGWAILFMVTYPEIQNKVQEELDRVVGRSRKPKLSDRSSLPYTMATIQEILRLATTAPITLPHLTMKTCQIGGYTLPKDTEVWANLWEVLRDPQIWPDPLVLKPERFLDESGQLRQREEYIGFGLGRRSCLGEQLAKQELFIFFTSLLHSFTFTPPEGEKMEPTAKGAITITHQPPQYRACATYRD